MKALADETRFKIFSMLLNSDWCVGALARKLGVTEANVSQHLQILRKAGLVVGEKRGYWTHYSVVPERLIEMSSALELMAKDMDTLSFQCPRTNRANEQRISSSCCRGCHVLQSDENGSGA